MRVVGDERIMLCKKILLKNFRCISVFRQSSFKTCPWKAASGCPLFADSPAARLQSFSSTGLVAWIRLGRYVYYAGQDVRSNTQSSKSPAHLFKSWGRCPALGSRTKHTLCIHQEHGLVRPLARRPPRKQSPPLTAPPRAARRFPTARSSRISGRSGRAHEPSGMKS